MSKALKLTITNLVQDIASNNDSETLAASCKAIVDYIGEKLPGLSFLGTDVLEWPVGVGFFLLGPGSYDVDAGTIIVPEGSIAILRTDEDPFTVTYIQVVRPAHIPTVESPNDWAQAIGTHSGDLGLYDDDGTLTLVVADGEGGYAYVALTAAV